MAAPGEADASEEVVAFLRRYQPLLPWPAVEQILRAGGRRSDLKAAARIYRVWPIVFSLSLPGARCATLSAWVPSSSIRVHWSVLCADSGLCGCQHVSVVCFCM